MSNVDDGHLYGWDVCKGEGWNVQDRAWNWWRGQGEGVRCSCCILCIDLLLIAFVRRGLTDLCRLGVAAACTVVAFSMVYHHQLLWCLVVAFEDVFHRHWWNVLELGRVDVVRLSLRTRTMRDQGGWGFGDVVCRGHLRFLLSSGRSGWKHWRGHLRFLLSGGRSTWKRWQFFFQFAIQIE